MQIMTLTQRICGFQLPHTFKLMGLIVSIEETKACTISGNPC